MTFFLTCCCEPNFPLHLYTFLRVLQLPEYTRNAICPPQPTPPHHPPPPPPLKGIVKSWHECSSVVLFHSALWPANVIVIAHSHYTPPTPIQHVVVYSQADSRHAKWIAVVSGCHNYPFFSTSLQSVQGLLPSSTGCGIRACAVML